MASKKSTIPPKAQIPAAIVLGILFVFILIWRFGGKEEPATPPAPDSQVPVAAQTASVDDLRLLLARFTSTEASRRQGNQPRSPIQRSPFTRPRDETPQEKPAEKPEAPPQPPPKTAQTPISSQPLGPSRKERLDALRLTGTVLSGGFRVAVFDGRLLRAGDEIDGFTIQTVDERQVELRDGHGTVTLSMAEDYAL